MNRAQLIVADFIVGMSGIVAVSWLFATDPTPDPGPRAGARALCHLVIYLALLWLGSSRKA